MPDYVIKISLRNVQDYINFYLFILLFFAVADAGEGTEDILEPLTVLNDRSRFTSKRAATAYNDNHLEATFTPYDHLVPSERLTAYFGNKNNTQITAQTGSTVLLPCVIHNIGDGTVSWIRRKDYHLLTVGLTTYSSDERFQSLHLQHSEDWTLHIKFLQRRDAGAYECQVSSHPPISIFVHLSVVEASAQISGPPEKYLKPGSTLHLQCMVIKSTESPSYVFWYHNDRMINYDLDRGVNVTTDLSQRVSDLVILTTTSSHTGNYTCVPNNAHADSVLVHVFYGENPAAMQSASSFFCTGCVGYSIAAAVSNFALSKMSTSL